MFPYAGNGRIGNPMTKTGITKVWLRIAMLFGISLAPVVTHVVMGQSSDSNRNSQQAVDSRATTAALQEKYRVESQRNLRKRGHPESFIEVRSIVDDRLLHRFTVPGRGHKFIFSPDGSKMISTDRRGNLGTMTTVRAFDLRNGTQRLLGECPGDLIQIRFSPDGSRLVVAVGFGFFSQAAIAEEEGMLCFSQARVWCLDDLRDPVKINFGPTTDEAAKFDLMRTRTIDEQELAAGIERIVPHQFRFSANGQTMVTETPSGWLAMYDCDTGKVRKADHQLSVNTMTAAMIMALKIMPSDVSQFSVSASHLDGVAEVHRDRDGWWKMVLNEKLVRMPFKVQGDRFLIKEGGKTHQEVLWEMLGLDVDADLFQLDDLKHPLGSIKIQMDMQSIGLQLLGEKDSNGQQTSSEQVRVRWVN